MFYLLLALLILFTEDCIKKKITEDENLPRRICRGHILLRCFHNQGLALGQLKRYPWLPKAIVSLVMLVFLIYTIPLVWEGAAPLLGIALGLLYGGGLSNLIDRYRRGYVVDYFTFCKAPWKFLRRLVFNLADMCIFLAIGLMLIYACLNW